MWKEIKRKFPQRLDILQKTYCVTQIKSIDIKCYRTIIDGCRLAADELQCKLIEVEQLWELEPTLST